MASQPSRLAPHQVPRSFCPGARLYSFTCEHSPSRNGQLPSIWASRRTQAHGRRHDVTTCPYGTTGSALHAVKPGTKPDGRELSSIIGWTFMFAAIEACGSCLQKSTSASPSMSRHNNGCSAAARNTLPAKALFCRRQYLITDKLALAPPAQKSPAPFPKRAVPLAHRFLGRRDTHRGSLD